jgi:hypothetical protein
MKKVLIILLLAVLGVSSGCSLNFLNKPVSSPPETGQDGQADQESQ